MAEPETTRGQQPPPAPPPASEKQDPPRSPVTEMLDAMSRYTSTIKERDPTLAEHIASLRTEAADAVRGNQRELHHLVAYAAQDAEKTLGHQLPLSEMTRANMEQLAGSAPGLENKHMLEIMQQTGKIADKDTIQEIRHRGSEIGRQADQQTPAIQGELDQLENRLRQADRPPPLSPAPHATGPAQAAEKIDTPQPQPGAANADAPEARSRVRATGNQGASGPERGSTDPSQQQAQAQAGYGRADPTVYQRSALDSILDVVRAGVSAVTPAPWEAQPQPFGERLAAYQARNQAGRDDAGLQNAEKAGRTALEALDGFRTGEGATVMNRIQSAARSDPEGMSGVLSGMRDGGRYQDLRQQFNNALHDEAGAARAYDKAAESLGKYAEARTGVEEIIARRPDAANLTAKFQQMDAEIGEKAEGTPSRREGKSMIEDISKQAAEIIQHAMEALKSIFTRSGPGPTSSPGPSPS